MTMPTIANLRAKLKRKSPVDLAVEKLKKFQKPNSDEYDVWGAYDSGEYEREFLAQVFGEDVITSVEKLSGEYNADMAALEPYRVEDNYLVRGALNAGVPADILKRRFGEDAMTALAAPVPANADILKPVNIENIPLALPVQETVEERDNRLYEQAVFETQVLPTLPGEIMGQYFRAKRGDITADEFNEIYRTWQETRKLELTELVGKLLPGLNEIAEDKRTGAAMAYLDALYKDEAVQAGFVEAIRAMGHTPEAEDIIKGVMPGFTARDIKIIFGENVTPLEQLPLAGYRISEQPLQDVMDYAVKDPEGLRRAVRYEGRTPETEALLESVYGVLPDNYLDKYFETGPADDFLTGKWLPKPLKDYWGMAVQGIGDILSMTGGVADRFGADGMAEELKLAGTYGQVYAKDVKIADKYTPQWFAQNMARMAPLMLGLMGVSIITGGTASGVIAAAGGGTFLQAAGAAVVSGVVSSTGEGLMEAGDAYNEAKARGLNDAEAGAVFDRVFQQNVALLSGSNTVQYGLTFFIPGGKATSFLVKALTYGFDAASEGAEEAGQLAIQRGALGEPQRFDDEMLQSLVLGTAGGFAFAGIGTVNSLIQEKIINKMPESDYDQFRQKIQSYIGLGFSRKEAEAKTWDEFAGTPEGLTAVKEAADEVMAEEAAEMRAQAPQAQAAVKEISGQAGTANEQVDNFVNEFTEKDSGTKEVSYPNIEKDNAITNQVREIVQKQNEIIDQQGEILSKYKKDKYGNISLSPQDERRFDELTAQREELSKQRDALEKTRPNADLVKKEANARSQSLDTKPVKTVTPRLPKSYVDFLKEDAPDPQTAKENIAKARKAYAEGDIMTLEELGLDEASKELQENTIKRELSKPKKNQIPNKEAQFQQVQETVEDSGVPPVNLPKAPAPPTVTPSTQQPQSQSPVQARKVEDVVKSVVEAIRDAKPAREATEQMKHKELQKRAAVYASILQGGQGSKAFDKAKSALKGELPQADFELDLVKFEISEADIQTMFEKIRLSNLRPFQKLNTAEALNKLLTGQIPTEGDINLLEKMFGKELADAILSKLSGWQKAGKVTQSVLNIPRTLQTIADLSATLRQGIVLAFGQPIQFGKSFVNELKAVFSENNYNNLNDILDNMRYSQEATEHKLYQAHNVGTASSPSAYEEAFQARILEHVPIIKNIVRASERAYNMFLDTLRMETWAYWCRKWEGTGKSWNDYDKLADFINHATGRGDLGKFENAASWLNAAFFSPRFIASRIQVPLDLITTTPAVRKIIARNLVAFVGSGLLAIMLAKLGGAETEDDPRSADFGKIKIGNTRLDIWGSYLPYARFVTQVITGERKSTSTGDVYDINRKDIAANFLRSKLAPVPGMLWDLAEGKTFIGDEINAKNAGQLIFERLTPMFLQDVIESVEDSGGMGALYGVLSALGVGVQTYEDNWNTQETKLGLPVNENVLPYTAAVKIYTAKYYYSEIGRMIGDATADMLKKKKTIPAKVVSVAEARDLKKELEVIPNHKLTSLNADPAKGDTFIQYFMQWQAREKITDETELKEFDNQYPQAYIGNITQNEYVLLQQYHNLTGDEQKQFLKAHPELNINPRIEWLKAHPQENAVLSLWGQADIYTQEAYSKVMTLAKSLDIPENALVNIPPAEIAGDYFKYQDSVNATSANSWETQLIIVQNDKLKGWLGREDINTPAEALELQIKHRELYDIEASYRDKDSANYIADDDLRAAAIKALKTANTEWVDDMRRVEAIKNNGSQYQNDWAERGKTVDRYGAGSSEAKLWLLEHGEVFRWALGNKLLTDDGAGWNKKVLEIDVEYRGLDKQYESYGDEESNAYIDDEKARAEARKALLVSNPEYADAQARRAVYAAGGDDAAAENNVEYATIVRQYSGGSAEARLYRIDHPDFDLWGRNTETFGWSEIKDNVNVLRINAQWRIFDEQYEAIKDADPDTQARLREEYLNERLSYKAERRRREAYQLFGGGPVIPVEDELEAARQQFYNAYGISPETAERLNTVELYPTKEKYGGVYEGEKIGIGAAYPENEEAGTTSYLTERIAHEFGHRMWDDLTEEAKAAFTDMLNQRPELGKWVETHYGVGAPATEAYATVFAQAPTAVKDGVMTAEDYKAFYPNVMTERLLGQELRGIPAQGAYQVPEEMVEMYVAYMDLPLKGKRRDRFLIENPEFARMMHKAAGIDLPDTAPSVQYDDIYDQYAGQFEKLEGLADNKSKYYIEDPEEREKARDALRFKDGKLTEFGLAEIKRQAYANYIADEYIERYAGYYKVLAEGRPENWPKDRNGNKLTWYEDDWYLQEHPEFYENVYLGVLELEPVDFSMLPSREVFQKYAVYSGLPEGKRRDDYRAANRDLDKWLVAAGIVTTPIGEKTRRSHLTPAEQKAEEVAKLRERLKR